MKNGNVVIAILIAVMVAGTGAIAVAVMNNTNDTGHEEEKGCATIILDSNTGLTPTGDGTYDVGSTVKVNVIADETTTFIHWVDDKGDIVSETAEYTFSVPSKGTIKLFAVGNTNVPWFYGVTTKLYSEKDWDSAIWTIYQYDNTNSGTCKKIGESTDGYFKFDTVGNYKVDIVAQKSGSTVNKTTEMSIGSKMFSCTWTSYGHLYSVKTNISLNDYEIAQKKVPADQRALKDDMTNALDFITPDDIYIDSIAEQMERQMKNHGIKLTDKEKVGNVVLDFVQISIEYAYDEEQYHREEYWAFPLETLFTEKGDCEDTTFLFSTIMKNMGFDTVVTFVFYNDETGHAFSLFSLENCQGSDYTILDKSGISDGKKYYCCETTTSGQEKWNIGADIPYIEDLIESFCFKTDMTKPSRSNMYTIYIEPAFVF